MITKSTVLILGAGASIPFGFPSGRNLLTKICDSLENHSSDFFRKIQNCGFEQDLIRDFRNELFHSMQTSVDAFLEKRIEFIDVGKAVIAAILMPYEQEEKLFRQKGAPNWYEYLFSKLDANKEDFIKNKLTVITFNYDRSFEHFFFTALKHSYCLTNEESAELLNTIKVIHIHGRLGNLPYCGDNIIPYNYIVKKRVQPEDIKTCIPLIKIIHELEDDTPELIESRQILNNSDKICFLGFGYHSTNIRRLMKGFKEDSFVTDKIIGTAYGVGEGDRTSIIKFFEKVNKTKINLGSTNEDVFSFLKRFYLT